MVGSEVYSTEIKKTEVLMENFRRAIGKYLLKTMREGKVAVWLFRKESRKYQLFGAVLLSRPHCHVLIFIILFLALLDILTSLVESGCFSDNSTSPHLSYSSWVFFHSSLSMPSRIFSQSCKWLLNKPGRNFLYSLGTDLGSAGGFCRKGDALFSFPLIFSVHACQKLKRKHPTLSLASYSRWA